MSPEELAPLLKKLRKLPLHKTSDAVQVDYGRDALQRILPHRDPFLLIDGIDSVDLQRQTVRGHRRFHAEDPVFAGHFPTSPVYPGVLQVEMTGQLGLCLAHFVTKSTHEITPDASPAQVRALKIHYAQYQLPIVPGDIVEVHAAILDEDGMTATCAGQIVKSGQIASFAVQEVYFVE